ncbi:MAG: ParB family chromosome partitioning protein [Parasphingorhabdus sp.]|jgi:ParB family chromosome partitioning protein
MSESKKSKANPKKSRLGRGLDALITPPLSPSPTAPPSTSDNRTGLLELEVGKLKRGRYQPRTHMDEKSLEELAASIRSQGVIQPILVRETGSGSYEIIAGERRWRASQLAGLTTVPVVVRQVDDSSAMAVALIENIQREDLNPIEEAAGLKRLLDEFGLTHQDAAEKVGRSRAAVSNLLRLLNLDMGVRDHLEAGHIEMGHARALLPLEKDQQARACDVVMHRRLSVRQTEQYVRSILSPSPVSKNEIAAKSADIQHLENRLSEQLGASVNIEHNGKKGRLVIDYHSLDELDGIIEKIG